MYRTIAIFPGSADEAQINRLVASMAEVFKQSPGFRSMTASVDALMGPSARSGEFGRVVEADFDGIDDVMTALSSEALATVREEVEALDTTLLLFDNVEI